MIAWRVVAVALAVVLATPADAKTQGEAELALGLVNQARAARGLPSLSADPILTEAAAAHAGDMLARGYLSHVSPEGRTVLDRYWTAGGSRWAEVGENIARCFGCADTPESDLVRQFHEGWMNSAEHRENILAPGFTRFGFAQTQGEGGVVAAVQTFAGPGSSPAGPSRSRGAALTPPPPGLLTERAVAVVNEARGAERREALEGDASLARSAAGLARELLKGQSLPAGADLLRGIDEGARPRWRGMAVVVAQCGGCGAEPAEGDVRYFHDFWFSDAQNRRLLLDAGFDMYGFAVIADGEGRKVAVGLLGDRAG